MADPYTHTLLLSLASRGPGSGPVGVLSRWAGGLARPSVVTPALMMGAALLSPAPAMGQSSPTLSPGAAVGSGEGVTERLSFLRSGFGGSVAVGEEEVFVGEGDTSLRPGSVYIYRKDASGAWVESQTLTIDGGDPGDGFGTALALDGSNLLVTAPEQNDGRGAVHHFRKGDDGSWTRSGGFHAAGVEAGDGFGLHASLNDGWAFVGSPGSGGEREGSVVVFRRGADGAWEETATLGAEGAQPGDLFGSVVASSGELLVVGAPGRGDRAGVAFAFRRSAEGDRWEPAGSFQPSGVERNHQFAASLAIRNGRILAGSPGNDGGFGAVFVFRPGDDGGWIQEGRLVAFDGARPDGFGSALATTGEELWVGSPRSHRFQGAAYVLREEDGLWREARRITGSQPRERDLFGTTLAAQGEVAAIGLAGADQEAGLVAIFERQPDGSWAESAVIAPPPESLPVIAGETVPCGDDGKAGIFDCRDVEILSFLPIVELGGERGIRLNDVWGWTDEETGREYALVGRTDGTAFVDITDAENPVYIGEVLRTEGSPTSIWRDMKVYENHAYIVADASGNHGMQVFDLIRLREFQDEPITWEPDLTYDRIASAHNVVINKETGFAYAVGASGGGETCGGGLHMIDIRTPKNPTFVGCFSDPETGRASTGYTHDAQCVVYRGPDERHHGQEICFGANETALSIADVTDKDAPVALSRASYPNVAYSHQGWLTEDQHYFYMNDELDELAGLVDRTRTIIWDVSRLDDPQVVGEYFAPVSASDHNLYVVGDLMYQSNYASGLRIIDISDPLNPEEVGYLDTAPFEEPVPGFEGSWSNYPFFESGTIAVSSIGEGLFLLRFTPRPALVPER